MVLVTYVEHNGTQHQTQVRNGDSVMQGAVTNLIEGIVAECGGALACATCHCYVAHLARMEMKVSITEFLRRIPDFRVKEGTKIEYWPGGVVGPKALPLTWSRN